MSSEARGAATVDEGTAPLPFPALVDELVAQAMNLGAMKAPDGILKLTDRVMELRDEVVRRGSGR